MIYLVSIGINKIQGFLTTDYDFDLSTVNEDQLLERALKFSLPQEADAFIQNHAEAYIKKLGMRVTTIHEFLVSSIIDS